MLDWLNERQVFETIAIGAICIYFTYTAFIGGL